MGKTKGLEGQYGGLYTYGIKVLNHYQSLAFKVRTSEDLSHLTLRAILLLEAEEAERIFTIMPSHAR